MVDRKTKRLIWIIASTFLLMAAIIWVFLDADETYQVTVFSGGRPIHHQTFTGTYKIVDGNLRYVDDKGVELKFKGDYMIKKVEK